MRKSFLFSCAAVLVLGYAASSWAQCAGKVCTGGSNDGTTCTADSDCTGGGTCVTAGTPRELIFAPAKANKFQATLVQAMTSCTLPDTATGGGTPACTGVGPISDRFAWCEGGSGSVKFKTGPTKCKTDGSFPDCAFNPTSGVSGDIFIGLKLKGVCWGASGVTPGATVGETTAPVSATVQLLGRPTTEDSDVGVIQIIDFPAPVSFDIVKGKGKVKTSVNALINAINISSLSSCTVIEPIDVAVLDDLGGRFATPGTYLGKGN